MQKKINIYYYINVQGDEPLIDPNHILILKFTINQKLLLVVFYVF